MKTQIGLAALLAALSTGAIAQNFNDPAEFERQKGLLTVAPQGPDGKPWEQNLGGEKVDVILYDNDPAVFISKALAPAKVQSVDLDEATKTATVRTADDQLSLAIGKGGQNVRLASRLTGWKINVLEANASAEGEAAPEAPSEEAPQAEA